MPCYCTVTPPDDLFYLLAHRKVCCCILRFKDAAQTLASSVSDTLRATISVAKSDSIISPAIMNLTET